jgi:antitoxin component of MazEF toxin-antitoxin module
MNTATLRNWGGSVALPIPRNLLAMLSLDAGAEVDVDVQDGKIIIAPSKPKYSFEQLMKEHKALKLPKDTAWLDFEDLPSERI